MKVSRYLYVCVVVVLYLFAVGSAYAKVTTSSKITKKKVYTFDGFKLGDNYGPLMSKKPYHAPCDNDPIDKGRLRAMVYGALPCRGRSFPEKTSVIFFLKMNRPKQSKYGQPIVGFAFLGGRYFHKRSNFPVHPGDALRKGLRTFGKPLTTFQLSGRGNALTAYEFNGHLWLLVDGAVIRGVVLSKMPRNARNEQWRVLWQMYRKYTPKAAVARKGPAVGGQQSSDVQLCKLLWTVVPGCTKHSRIARKMFRDKAIFPKKCLKEIRRGARKIIQCLVKTHCKKWRSVCLKRRPRRATSVIKRSAPKPPVKKR